MPSRVAPRFSRTAFALAVLGGVSLSACSETPAHSAMTMRLPTPASGSHEGKNTVYATPAPGSGPTVTPSVDPSPIPPPVVIPPVVTPSPRPSANPFNPFPIWPNPHPSTRPNPPANPGDILKFFTRKFAQAFGVYDRGYLEEADTVPSEGQGFLKVFQDRDRAYGTLDLVMTILSAAKEIHRDIPSAEVVQIGDLSTKRGGHTTKHASHQNGLDADVVFFKKNHHVMAATGSRPGETGFDEEFVDRKGNISPNFDIDTSWRFIQLLVSTNRVDRIFADQYIKREFCRYAVAKGMREEWKESLRKIRHWKNHRDHMHVRLICPPNSPKCVPIPALPEGDGCDEFLGRDGRRGIVRMEGELLSEPSGDPADEHGC